MLYNCPHCGFPHLACETRSTPFNTLVDTEGMTVCKCGAKFNYHCVVIERYFFGLFSRVIDDAYVEYRNIEFPDTKEFYHYTDAIIKREIHELKPYNVQS